MDTNDAARRQVVERNLAPAAFGHLTADAFMNLPFEALGPTKALLKRFFSVDAWTAADDDALAAAVGPGEGWWARPLDPDVTLEYGWRDGRFAVSVVSSTTEPAAEPATGDLLAGTFDGPVVPEATPNPRTIRFHTGTIHDGPSRWYESAAVAAGDRSVSRLFGEFEDITSVLVGPEFVAVSLRRPDDWERLLHPILAAVTEEFEGGGDSGPAARRMGGPAAAGRAGASTAPARRRSRLERAWAELGPLRLSEPDDVAALLRAATGDDPFHRQVAANLLREVDPWVAADHWAGLLADPSRSVRRATIDAIGDVVSDVGREGLRPLLERALADTDAWVRWKAIRGLVELGPEPSRDAIAALSHDDDFRVRLEVASALRPPRE